MCLRVTFQDFFEKWHSPHRSRSGHTGLECQGRAYDLHANQPAKRRSHVPLSELNIVQSDVQGVGKNLRHAIQSDHPPICVHGQVARSQSLESWQLTCTSQGCLIRLIFSRDVIYLFIGSPTHDYYPHCGVCQDDSCRGLGSDPGLQRSAPHFRP